MSTTLTHPMSAASAFSAHPALSARDFVSLTGLSVRSYYAYKRKLQTLAAQPLQLQKFAATAVQMQHTDTAAPALQSGDTPAVAVQPEPTATAAPEVQTAVQPAHHSTWILYGIFTAATVASVHNMYVVMSEITMDRISALSLTAVFACTAIGFTAAGLRERYTYWLIIALVAFEAFCNAVNVYAGLYDFTAHTGTHFLCKVQSLVYFISLQHCAVAIALFAAGCIAGVQYCALREISHRH